MRLTFKITIFIYLFCLNANALEFKGEFKQGSFILGKTSPDNKISVDDRNIRVSKDGYFAFGLDRDRKNDVIIKIESNGDTKTIVKKVFKRKYKIQRIDGLPEKKVTPPKEFYERIKKENKLISNAREVDSDLSFFKDQFIIPVDDAIITGVYGSQRILNGIPKWPHYGLDFAQKKDKLSEIIINDVLENLGRGLASILATLNPSVIILGGSVAEGLSKFYWDKIITKTAKYSIPFYKSDPPIQMTTLGEDASILGASIIASS